METQLAEAAPNPASADVSASDAPITIADLKDASLEQLDQLLERGSVTLQPKPGGEGKLPNQVETPAAKVETPAPGETPAAGEVETAVAGEVEVETRTAEEIAAAEATASDEAATAAAAAAEDDKPEGIERPRFKNERDQLIAGLYKKAEREGNPISWAEAESRIDGPKKAEETKPAEPAVDYAGVVTTLEGEIAALDTQLEGFDEGLYTKEVRDLTTQRSNKAAELLLAKRDLQDAGKNAERAEATAREVSNANRAKSHEKAVAEFPAAADDTTPLGKAIAKKVAEINNPKHPDHAIIWADSAPYTIAAMVAAELGIAPVAKKKAANPTPATAKVEAPPRKIVDPAAGNKTAVQPGKPAEDGKAQVDLALHGNVSLADLDAVQGMPDPNKLLVGAVR